ncbi:MAG: G1 family endopeptidase [Acidibacillus sp.]|nr:G1 family endopeptidase [Acidibacillus sp.]
MKNATRKLIVASGVTCIIISSLTISQNSFAQTEKMVQSKRDTSTVSGDYFQPGLVVYVPPQNLDLLTASDSKLAQYGIPSRPSAPSKLAEWKQAFGSVKHWVRPTFTLTNETMDESDENWSGLTFLNLNSPASRVVGWWTQPYAYAPTQDQPAYSATWVGLGGAVDEPLIQGGTFSNVNSGGGGSYNVWYEIVQTNKQTEQNGQPAAVAVSGLNNQPGDQMYCDIRYSNGTANFYYHDITNGNAVSFSITGITGFSNYGDVDWITERPDINGAPAKYMADYGSVTFTAEEGTPSSVSYPTVSSQYDTYYYVTENGNSNTDTLSYVSSHLNSTGNFTTSWKNYS